jgi:hypothetical protein
MVDLLTMRESSQRDSAESRLNDGTSVKSIGETSSGSDHPNPT